MSTIKEICDYIHNYFEREYIEGTHRIVGGALDVSNIPLIEGQYYMIKGSILNDGIYKHPTNTLNDEEFKGAVITLSIPSDVLDVAKDIETWEQENASNLLNPMQSESFGGYSYTRATSNSKNGGSITWRDVFGRKLDPYRKIG
jgi:hypothetical protein